MPSVTCRPSGTSSNCSAHATEAATRPSVRVVCLLTRDFAAESPLPSWSMASSSTQRLPGGYGDQKLKALLDEMQEIVALVRREGPGLWRRARAIPAVGFPARTGPGQIGSGCD